MLSICMFWYWTCTVSWFTSFDAFLCKDYHWLSTFVEGFCSYRNSDQRRESERERVVITYWTQECNLSGFCTVSTQAGSKRRFLMKILLSKARQRVKGSNVASPCKPQNGSTEMLQTRGYGICRCRCWAFIIKERVHCRRWDWNVWDGFAAGDGGNEEESMSF